MADTLVMIVHGKGDSADYAAVRSFPDVESARLFCAAASTGRTKYWTTADIVAEGDVIELNSWRPREV